jgi:hypothetical protein
MGGKNCVAVLVVVASLAGCNSTASKIEKLTYIDGGVLAAAENACRGGNCNFKYKDKNWRSEYFIASKNPTTTFPLLASTYRAMAEAPTVTIPSDDIRLVFSKEVPCPERAECVAVAMAKGAQLLSAKYSICYEPRTDGMLTDFVKPEIIEGAWDFQAKRLPALAKAVEIPVSDSGVSGYRFNGVTKASFDESEFFAAGYHVTKSLGLGFNAAFITGCVNVYYVARVPGVTEDFIKKYERRAATGTAAEKKVKSDWKSMTEPR